MIKISNKDSIIDIIKKIESCEEKEIVLDFPIWNSILHNYTSLKILKAKAWKKQLIIITNDLNAKKIWRNLWIKYSLLNDKNLIKNIDLLKYNYSFYEYFLFLIKSYLRELKNFFVIQKDNHNNRSKYNLLNYEYLKNEKSRIGYFIFWLLASVLLFLFVFYFAVNKTYIAITPEIIIKNRAKNFIFRESSDEEILWNSEIIKLKKISKLVYLTEKFWTYWVKETWNIKSKWKVMVYNYLFEDLWLLKNTRLETKDWITYFIENWITIPKAKKDKTWKIIPWSITTEVIARNFDNKWIFVWTRWNIKSWITLIFPWLKDVSKEVFAKTITKFEWWNDNYTKVLWQDDIKNAKIIFEEKLKMYALKELKNEIKLENEKNNITYDIPSIEEIINYSDLTISWEEKLKIWEEMENFELTWTIKITTYIFNKDLVINRLKNIIKEWLIEEVENINYINDKSLRVSDVIYKNNYPFEMKATAEIEVFYSHNFLKESEDYINKLKTNISWLDIEEAKKILLNNPNISDVQIDTRPFFINKVSNIPNNIEFEVTE